MAHPSDPELLTLHTLRLAARIEVAELAARAGLGEDETRAILEGAADRGEVRELSGAAAGWALTADGRRADEARLAAELDGLGPGGGGGAGADRRTARDVIASVYESFRTINPDLLALCTDWQVRVDVEPNVVKDHLEADYDAGGVERLAAPHAPTEKALVPLGGVLERFAGYLPRLRNALAQVQGGDGDFFTKPMIDSYHTIWFELHEDLLATLGLDRAAEHDAGSAG